MREERQPRLIALAAAFLLAAGVVPAAAFVPHDSSVTWTRPNAAICKTSGGFNSFWAPLNVPNGVDMSTVEVHYEDNTTADDGFVCITRYDVDAGYNNDEECRVFPAGNPGDTTFAFDPAPGHNISDNRHPWVIHVFPDTDAGNFCLYGVRVAYTRDVSAAPGTATFGDVPTGHIFFKFVEALAAAGITSGCGGGDFCPDDPLTRGQMAAFLAGALGLHFPDDAVVP